MISRVFACAKDVQLVHSAGNVDGGVGAGNVISVGQNPGNASKTRTEFEFQADWTNAKSVSQALLRLKVTNNCGAPGNAVRFWVEKVTVAFKEGDFADTCGVGSTNVEVWPGTSDAGGSHSTTNRGQYIGAPSDGDVLSVDITALCEALRAAGDKKVRLRLIAADVTTGYEETNAARFCGFWSREKGNDSPGYKPRIEVQLDDHVAPDAVADVFPATTNYAQQGEAATRVDTTFTVTGRFVTTDSTATHITASQVQFYPATATDDANFVVSGGAAYGTITGTGVKSDYGAGALLVSQTVTVPQALVGKEIRGRVRLRDDNDEWSPWTRIGAMRLVPNNRPNAPTNLGIDSQSAPNPVYSGRHNDADAGSTVKAVETQVWTSSANGTEIIENHASFYPGDSTTSTTGNPTTFGGDGAQSVAPGGTAWSVAHDGRALNAGERITRRHRTVDQYDAVGRWSDNVSWTVGDSALPTVIPQASAKQDSVTPAVGASYREEISGLLVEVYARNDLTSQLLWRSGEIAVAASLSTQSVTYGSSGTAVDLQWGQHPWLRVQVRIRSTGGLTDWTALSLLWVNALATAPALSLDNSGVGNDGVLRVGSLTPRIRMPFADPDLPNDVPAKQVARVTTPGGSLVWTATATTDILDYVDVPVSASLAYETAYVATGQYADSSGELGPLGSLAFTTHRPPTLATGTAPAVADPTPTLPWTATFYGSATQRGYRVRITDVTAGISNEVFDSGFIESASAVSYVVPAYVLLTAHAYQAAITVTDTLGVSSTLNGITIVDFVGSAAFEMLASAALTVSDALPADTFTRSVTDGWGTSSSGSVYEYSGALADFDTTGTTGTTSLPAGQGRQARMIGPNYAAITATVKVKSDKLAVGGAITAGLIVGSFDLANFLRVNLQFKTDQTDPEGGQRQWNCHCHLPYRADACGRAGLLDQGQPREPVLCSDDLSKGMEGRRRRAGCLPDRRIGRACSRRQRGPLGQPQRNCQQRARAADLRRALIHDAMTGA
jgi:hypothetical protein